MTQIKYCGRDNFKTSFMWKFELFSILITINKYEPKIYHDITS